MRKEWIALRDRLLKLRDEYRSERKWRPSWELQAMLIVGEDHRFFRHSGVDPVALVRACWRTYAMKKREGGSTIEMQLVRVLTGRYEKTLYRKVCEIWFSMRLSSVVLKEDLPALYLLVGYYGWRMNGLKQACGRLNINPSSITLSDAAQLVARLKYPQPQQMPQKRHRQIEERCIYLLRRYNKLITGRCINRWAKGDKNGTIQDYWPSP